MRRAILLAMVAFTFLLLLQTASSAGYALSDSTVLSGNIAVESPGPTNSGSTARVFTIIVSSAGFNGSADPISIQVSQGDDVTIKFLYGDQSLNFDNVHVIGIDGYNIETGKITKKTPVQEVRFTAGQVGTFQFHCTVPCYGMENLQQGSIVVSPSTQGTSIGTSFSQMKVVASGDSFSISARLTDANNIPVPGAIVNFLVNTDFGSLNLGHNVTGSNGAVHFLYSSGSGYSREMTITAYFAGSGHYSQSKATAVFSPPIAQPSDLVVLVNPELMYPRARPSLTFPYVSGQMASIDLRLVGVHPIAAWIIVIVGLIVVVSVWSVYGLVLKEIFAIRKAGKGRRENWWTTEN